MSDSMTGGKDPLIMPEGTVISTNPGASVNDLADKIIKHQIKVKDFCKIILLIGIVDLLNIHQSSSVSYRNIEFRQLMRRFTFLLRTIRSKNPHALILVSGILPCPRFHNDIGLRIRSVNFALHVISAKFGNCLYLDTPSAFSFELKPIQKYFRDKLHLSKPGMLVLSSRFRQALSHKGILKQQSAKKNLLMQSYPVHFD